MREIAPRCGRPLRTGRPCTRPEYHAGTCCGRTRQEATAWYDSDEGYKFLALRNARERAKAKSLPFGLTVADIPDLPEACPVLGISIAPKRGKGFAEGSSPSLDRIRPSLGYVPGNVRWISNRANMIKSNATARELWLVAQDSLRLEGED